jgi:[ribosomal protein S18]-alanine N-acetyltransferase
MNLTIRPMSFEDAKAVIEWHYDSDYSFYDFHADNPDEAAAYLTDPDNHFYGVYISDELVGHAVFHDEARVPGGDYRDDALDIGGGIRPDWTGQGKGSELIAQLIAFGRKRYFASVFRATIAAWNLRAQKATLKNGFREYSRFMAANSGQEFVIYVRQD